MEANRDGAERCIERAITAVHKGNYDDAEQLLIKAEKLYPTPNAHDLLKHVRQLKTTKNTSTNGGGGSAAGGPDNGPRRRQTGSESNNRTNEETQPTERKFTKDEVEIVDRIKRCKDYYQVLGITKDATESDIKRAYKKLALRLHPDKNNAPGAAEAFKAIGNAVAVLSDPQKRKEYDLYGSTRSGSGGGGNNAARQRSGFHATNAGADYAYAHNFESDFTAEELFNMFFSSGFSQYRHQQYQNQGTQQRRYQRRDESTFQQQPSLAFGLILVLILVSMLSSFFTSTPIYSLAQSANYPIRRNTVHLNIPYYVKENFETDYQGSLGRLENSVEEEYISAMKQACFRERSYRDAMLSRARSFGSRVQHEQAQALKVTSCENLAKLGLGKFTVY